MEDNEHINKHLKESMDGFSVQPKINSFEGVIKKLEKKRRRRFLIFFFPGVLLLLLGTVVLFKDAVDSKTPLSDTSTSNSVVKINPELKVTTVNPNPETNSNTKPESNLISSPATKIATRIPVSPLSTRDKITPIKKKITLNKTTSLPEHTPTTVKTTVTENKSEMSAEPIAQVSLLDETNFIEADKLNAKTLYLPLVTMHPDLMLNNEIRDGLVFPGNDSLKKKNKVKFLLGLAFNPQFGSYVFQKNSKATDKTFSEEYLTNKKEQNSFKYNYAWGIKTGVLIKEKWEILVGFGFQRYNQEEKVKPLTPTSPVPTVANFNQYDETFAFNSGVVAKSGEIYVSKYSYSDFSLEASRIADFRNLLKVKIGVGFHMQHLSFRTNSRMIIADSPTQFYYGNGYNSSINSWQSVINIKGGLIEDLGKSIQVQLCPNFFYMPNSMFKKDYVIKQKAFGFGLEALLLFKIG